MHPRVPLRSMTGDEFTARYRLREQLTDGDIVSYLASDDRDGNVLAHVFHGPSAPTFDASLLDEAGRDAVREILDVEGIAVVVTEPVEPFSTFEAWVAEHQRPSEKDGPGAFTRIFRVQSPKEPSGRVAEPETGPSVEGEGGAKSVSDGGTPKGPAGSGGDVEEPGEFTLAFGALRQPPPAPAPMVPPPADPDRPEMPVAPATEMPAASIESAGESSSGAAPPAEPPRPQQSAPPDAPPTSPPAEGGTGTFTRIMGAAHQGSGSAEAPPSASDAPSPTTGSAPRPSSSGSGNAPVPPRPGGTPSSPARPSAPAPPRPGGAPSPPAHLSSPPPPRPSGAPSSPAGQGAPAPPGPGGAPPPPMPPPARPSPPAPPAQGSRGTPPPPPPPPPFPGSPPPPSGGQGAEPGPYTRAMRAYKDSGQRRSPSPPAGSEDSSGSGYGGSESYLDRLRGRKPPDGAVDPPSRREEMPPPAQPEMRTTVPPVPSGPSEYTRVIRGAEAASLRRSGSGPVAYGSPPPTPTRPPAPAQPPMPEAAPGTSRTTVVVMLVVTVAVLVAVVLFFALRTS